MTGIIFALAGAAVGLLQVYLVVRSGGVDTSRLTTFGRIALVGAVLLLAARAGHFVAGVVGWAMGFFVPLVLSRRGKPG